MQNPFKVLGLTPEIVRKLDDAILIEAVKRNYRLLSRVFHPDAGGKSASFRELAEAYSLLDNPETFQTFKSEYLKPRKDRLEELLVELEQAQEKLSRSTEQYRSYVKTTISLGGVPFRGNFLLNDSLKKAIYSESSNQFTGKMEERSHFDLRVDENGLTRTNLTFTREVETDEDRKGFYKKSDGWVRVIVGQEKTVIGWKISSKPFPIDCSLVGSVSIDRVNDDGLSIKRALAIQGTREDFDRARNGYSWDFFQHLLPTLTPEVVPDSYLVGGKIVGGEINFFLIGKVVAIKRDSTV